MDEKTLSPDYDFPEVEAFDSQAIQQKATRQARNQRRNRRKKIAKYLANRGIELWAGCQLPPRMRKVLRFLNKTMSPHAGTIDDPIDYRTLK